MTGGEFADLIASYLVRNYGDRGLVVYREVSLGKSIIGKNRRIDILALHEDTSKALAIECKYQETQGTVDEKIPYALDDLKAMHFPAFMVYAGPGFSSGVVHMLQAHAKAAHCFPDPSLAPTKDTVELDHVVAMTFGWWGLVIGKRQPFEIPSDFKQ